MRVLATRGSRVTLSTMLAAIAGCALPQPGEMQPGRPRMEPAPRTASLQPFAPGEVCRYRCILMGFNAGTAVLETLRGDAPGELAFQLKGSTTGPASFLFDFSESARVECSADDLRPRLADVHSSVDGDDCRMAVVFDDTTGSVLVRYRKNGESKVSLLHDAEPWDPLSLAMLLRSMDLSPPFSRAYVVLLGLKLYRIELETVAVEEIEVPAGRFQDVSHVVGTVYRLRSDGSPGQKEGDDFDLWIATDAARRVVKMARPSKFGRVNFELLE